MRGEIQPGRVLPHPWHDWYKNRVNPEVETVLGEKIKVPSLSKSRGAWGERSKTNQCATCPHHVSKAEAERVNGLVTLTPWPNNSDGLCLYGQTELGDIIPKITIEFIDPGNKHCVSGDQNREKRAEQRRADKVLV